MSSNLLLNFGAAVLSSALGQSAGNDDATRQIKSIGSEVCAKMTAKENANRNANRLSVCGMYAHFFLSLVAVLECIVHLMIHLLLLAIMGLGYYIILCVSCGEWSAYSLGCLAHHTSMYGLYSGLLCGLLANIFRPWSPPLVGFHFPGNTLCRPEVPGLIWTDGSGSNSTGVCCFCLGSSNIYLPQYKIMQTFFFSFGGIYAFRSMQTCCSSEDEACGYVELLQSLHREVMSENSVTTQTFYRQEYQCDSFDELIARRLSASETGGSGVGPSLQQQINQQFASVAPTMIRLAQPAQQQQPVYAQATIIQGQPIAMARIV